MRNAFTRALEFRHACLHFRDDLLLSDEEIEFILDAGRLSPSSIDLEPWHFIVVRDEALKRAVAVASGGQEHVRTNSALIVVLLRLADIEPAGEYVRSMLRHEADEAAVDRLTQKYAQAVTQSGARGWGLMQCHIAAANMMTAAAYIGVDSCPVDHFDASAVGLALAIDVTRVEPAVLLPIGYRLHEPASRQRLANGSIVDYR
ncbi:MAG: nitroreductase family protein [Rudaea sp.]